jgi:hypothetical protein
MSENVKRNKNYTQVCVWEACVVGVDKAKEFIEFMKDNFGVRVQYLEEIKTLPDTRNGVNIPETGDRNDLFFAVHCDDIGKFAIPRLTVGIRWIEDVLASDNYTSVLYPSRVFEYKCW